MALCNGAALRLACVVCVIAVASAVIETHSETWHLPDDNGPVKDLFVGAPSVVKMTSMDDDMVHFEHARTRGTPVFVMYYAPWCAQSQRIAKHFTAAARELEEEAVFGAANCWAMPKCKEHHNITIYPHLVLFVGGESYVYYDGCQPWELVDYVRRMSRPFQRVTNLLQAVDIEQRDEFSVFVHVSCTHDTPEAQCDDLWAATRAMRSLGVPMAGGVVYDDLPLALEIGLAGIVPAALLVSRGNHTLSQFRGPFNADSLAAWIDSVRPYRVVEQLTATNFHDLVVDASGHVSTVILFLPLDAGHSARQLLREYTSIAIEFQSSEVPLRFLYADRVRYATIAERMGVVRFASESNMAPQSWAHARPPLGRYRPPAVPTIAVLRPGIYNTVFEMPAGLRAGGVTASTIRAFLIRFVDGAGRRVTAVGLHAQLQSWYEVQYRDGENAWEGPRRNAPYAQWHPVRPITALEFNALQKGLGLFDRMGMGGIAVGKTPPDGFRYGLLYDGDENSPEGDARGPPHVVVLLYRQYCGPCIAMRPAFKAVASRYRELTFVSFDVTNVGDPAPSLSKYPHLPVILFYSRGEHYPLVYEDRIPEFFRLVDFVKFAMSRHGR